MAVSLCLPHTGQHHAPWWTFYWPAPFTGQPTNFPLKNYIFRLYKVEHTTLHTVCNTHSDTYRPFIHGLTHALTVQCCSHAKLYAQASATAQGPRLRPPPDIHGPQLAPNTTCPNPPTHIMHTTTHCTSHKAIQLRCSSTPHKRDPPTGG